QWLIGRGRVMKPEKLTFTREIADRDFLYSDFTDLSSGSQGSMELYSEVIPQIPRVGACLYLSHIVKAIDPKTDRFEVYLQTLGTGKWSSIASSKNKPTLSSIA